MDATLKGVTHANSFINGMLRHEQLDGKDHLVAPAILIREGVWNNVYYPAKELSRHVTAWNGRPVTVPAHPTEAGLFVSASSKKMIESFQGGILLNTAWSENLRALVAEVWFDVVKCNKINPTFISRLENKGDRFEVSTGLLTDDEMVTNTFNGRQYRVIARNYRPDHFAVLLHAKGACSWDDGAGLPRINGAMEVGERWPDCIKANVFIINGGPGSGNHGHAGRPGERGGSAAIGRPLSGNEELLSDAMFMGKSAEARKEAAVTSITARLSSAFAAGDMENLGNQMRVLDPFTNAVDPARLVNQLIGAWASSSADHNPLSLAMQKAAAAEFGVDTARLDRYIDEEFASGPQLGRGYGLKYKRQQYDEFTTEAAQKGFRHFLRAQYDETQKYLQEQGVDEVTLFRGYKDVAGVKIGSKQTVIQNPMSSWSADPRVASTFATTMEGGRGVLLAATFKRADIQSVSGSGIGCLHEKEFVVRGGKTRVTAIRADGEFFDTDISKPENTRDNYIPLVVKAAKDHDELMKWVRKDAKNDPSLAWAQSIVKKGGGLHANAKETVIYLDDCTENADWIDRSTDGLVGEGEVWPDENSVKANGGPGSGYFNHPGRVGFVGGSATDDLGTIPDKVWNAVKTLKDPAKRITIDPGVTADAEKGIKYKAPTFEWYRDGKKIPEAEVKRIEKIMRGRPVMAAGYVRAWVSKGLKEPLQGVVEDEKGREQRVYDKKFMAKNCAEKHESIRTFPIEALRQQSAMDRARGKTEAFMVKLADLTTFRNSSGKDQKADVKSYGLSTLLGKHVQVNGDEIRFRFPAKEGIKVDRIVKDKELASFFKTRLREYGKGKLTPDTNDKKINKYIHRTTGGDYSVKDFRDFHASAIAARHMKDFAKNGVHTEKGFKAAVSDACEEASKLLGNKPAQCYATYIDPLVWDVGSIKVKGASMRTNAAEDSGGGSWITIGGTHVFIKDGETASDAFTRTTGKSLGGKQQHPSQTQRIRPYKEKETDESLRKKQETAYAAGRLAEADNYKAARAKLANDPDNRPSRDGRTASSFEHPVSGPDRERAALRTKFETATAERYAANDKWRALLKKTEGYLFKGRTVPPALQKSTDAAYEVFQTKSKKAYALEVEKRVKDSWLPKPGSQGRGIRKSDREKLDAALDETIRQREEREDNG